MVFAMRLLEAVVQWWDLMEMLFCNDSPGSLEYVTIGDDLYDLNTVFILSA